MQHHDARSREQDFSFKVPTLETEAEAAFLGLGLRQPQFPSLIIRSNFIQQFLLYSYCTSSGVSHMY
jgi:hypothetical protein